MCGGARQVPGSLAEALRMADAAMDYLNSPAVAELDGAGCGPVLTALGGVRAKFTAAHAKFLRRFDAADAHDGDGYASSASWLSAMTQMSPKAAKAAVRQMRQLSVHRQLAEAMADGVLSESWFAEIIEQTKKFPAELRAGTDQILAQAAAAGAGLDDLKVIVAAACERWRARHPDPDGDDGFDDRYVQVGTTFGGAGVIRGDLTAECAAAVQAVLESLGRKHGPEDHRTEAQRYHDALQLGCELLIRAKMVPDRAGADTRVEVHIPLSALRQMPGASALEQAWLRARTGEPGYLTGQDATAAACDAMIVPVVTGYADPAVIDQMIGLVLAHAGHGTCGHGHANSDSAREGRSDDGGRSDGGSRMDSRPYRPAAMSGQAHAALRDALARLAIDFVSGPSGLASALRTGLLQAPYNTSSLPLDIG